MVKPFIGIPIGDPSGIGPEIVIKALSAPLLYDLCRPVVVGSLQVLEKTAGTLPGRVRIERITEPAAGRYSPAVINIIDLDNVDAAHLAFGAIQKEAGKAAYEYICRTVELAKNQEIEAAATPPIHKEAIRAANINFIGHTEMLASMTQTNDPLTMFQVNNLRVFFLSRHVSLQKAVRLVKQERIITYIEKCHEALTMLGLKDKRIAIAGLNPHSGEHGLFGSEETEEIEPAVRILNKRGLKVEGPVSADSVFYQALCGKYDAVLSLYHDQGHIATKMVDFEKTISFTLGLPFLRTSVDHGTAFDIAGKGIASPASMIEAIKLAALYCQNYKGAAAPSADRS